MLKNFEIQPKLENADNTSTADVAPKYPTITLRDDRYGLLCVMR